MYGKRTFRRKYTGKRKYTGRGKRSNRSTVSRTVKKYVKRTIHANVPLKRDWNNGSGIVYNSLGLAQLPVQFPILPDMNQGTGEGERIGDRIKVRQSHIVVNVWARAYNSITNPGLKEQFVKLWIVKAKQLTQGATTIPNADIARWFQLGSTATGFSNDLTDISRDVNTNLFTVKYQKVCKIGFAGASAGGAAPPLSTTAPNNDFKLHHQFKINVGKYMKKMLTFQDNTTPVTNDNLYVVMQTVAYDNTNLINAPVEYVWEQHTSFEDV